MDEFDDEIKFLRNCYDKNKGVVLNEVDKLIMKLADKKVPKVVNYKKIMIRILFVVSLLLVGIVNIKAGTSWAIIYYTGIIFYIIGIFDSFNKNDINNLAVDFICIGFAELAMSIIKIKFVFESPIMSDNMAFGIYSLFTLGISILFLAISYNFHYVDNKEFRNKKYSEYLILLLYFVSVCIIQLTPVLFNITSEVW